MEKFLHVCTRYVCRRATFKEWSCYLPIDTQFVNCDICACAAWHNFSVYYVWSLPMCLSQYIEHYHDLNVKQWNYGRTQLSMWMELLSCNEECLLCDLANSNTNGKYVSKQNPVFEVFIFTRAGYPVLGVLNRACGVILSANILSDTICTKFHT